jgi:glucose/arabinose dehydrogenase
LGAHVAALGLVFNDKSNLPAAFKNGALVSQHGSWNRSVRSGYKVVFVPFEHGKPNGLPSDFVWGFVEQNEAYGRPVGLAFDIQGNVLIADDVGNRVWRVSPQSSRVGQ